VVPCISSNNPILLIWIEVDGLAGLKPKVTGSEAEQS